MYMQYRPTTYTSLLAPYVAVDRNDVTAETQPMDKGSVRSGMWTHATASNVGTEKCRQ